MGREDIEQLAQSFADADAGDGCPGDELGEVLGPVLEDGQHQPFSSAEVVLDHTPRHTGAPCDLVAAGTVEAALEDADNGGIDDELSGGLTAVGHIAWVAPSPGRGVPCRSRSLGQG